MPLLLVASPIIPLQTIQSLSNAQLFSLSRRQFGQETPRKCGFPRDQGTDSIRNSKVYGPLTIRTGERLVGFYLPPRWKILLDSQPVNYSSFRSWQEMEGVFLEDR